MSSFDYIRIDMDYCSSPVWVSNYPEEGFMNGGLDDIPKIPDTLKHALTCYQHLWEEVHDGKYWNCITADPKDWEAQEMKMLLSTLYLMELSLAIQVKKYHPEKHIYIWKDDRDHEIFPNKG